MDENTIDAIVAASSGVAKEGLNKLETILNGFSPFWDVKRQAVLTYIDDIKNSDLSPETKFITIANMKKTYKQMKNQADIASIAMNSAKDGTDFSSESPVDDDWLDRFFDSAKFVSDEKMKIIWGNILGKEFEKPGSTPPQVTRILSEITPKYAAIFNRLCALRTLFLLYPPSELPQFPAPYSRIIVPNVDKADYLTPLGITFQSLNELEKLGLINFDNMGYILRFDNKQFPKITIFYNSEQKTVTSFPNEAFPAGKVLLTEAGECIAKHINEDPVDGHFSSVIEYLSSQNVLFEEDAAK